MLNGPARWQRQRQLLERGWGRPLQLGGQTCCRTGSVHWPGPDLPQHSYCSSSCPSSSSSHPTPLARCSAATSSLPSFGITPLPLSFLNCNLKKNFFIPSIHPSIHFRAVYPGPGRGGSRSSRALQASFSPATLSSSSWGIPRCSQARRDI